MKIFALIIVTGWYVFGMLLYSWWMCICMCLFTVCSALWQNSLDSHLPAVLGVTPKFIRLREKKTECCELTDKSMNRCMKKKRLHYKFFCIKYTDEPQQQQQPNHLFKIVWAILMLPKQPWPLMGLTGLNLFQCIAWSHTVVWMLVLGLFLSSFYGVTEHSNLATDVRGCHGWVLLVYNISDIYKAAFTSAASRTLHYNVVTLFTSRVCGVNIEVDTVWVCFSCFTEGT